MKKINPPTRDIQFVTEKILNKFKSDPDFKEVHLNRANLVIKADEESAWSQSLILHENIYEQYAKEKTLFQCEPMDSVASVSKDIMRDLYNEDLKYAEDLREDLYALSPHVCPICEKSWGYDDQTLDHILPKKKFPQYAITPLNLVVTCNGCNKKKNTKYGKNINQGVIHPYFNSMDLSIMLECVLKIINNDIETIIQLKSRDTLLAHRNDLSEESYQRLVYFFDQYKLGERYSILARQSLQNIIDMYTDYEVKTQIELIEDINDENNTQRCPTDINTIFFRKLVLISMGNQLHDRELYEKFINLINQRKIEIKERENIRNNF